MGKTKSKIGNPYYINERQLGYFLGRLELRTWVR